MIELNKKLSDHFTLGEFLRSETAERHPEWHTDQYNPPDDVVGNLAYLAANVLEPVRTTFAYPIKITSGYRSKQVNDAVGSNDRSQHRRGQAADCQVDDRFLAHPAFEPLRARIRQRVLERVGSPMRENVNANFYLFAYLALRLPHFDVDQLIHEYGTAAGRPAWVHVSASPAAGGKKQILVLGGAWAGRGGLSVEDALALGTDRVPATAVARAVG